MIALVAEFPCMTCGTTLRMPRAFRVDALPVTLQNVTLPALPNGWTHDAQGVHCPAHQPSRVIPVGLVPPGILKGT